MFNCQVVKKQKVFCPLISPKPRAKSVQRVHKLEMKKNSSTLQEMKYFTSKEVDMYQGAVSASCSDIQHRYNEKYRYEK